MRSRDIPYISCSSIGSTISSSSEFSSSEDVEEVNGSGEYAHAGTVLEKRPRACCLDECGDVCRRRLGRSEVFRIAGLALSVSSDILPGMVRNGWRTGGLEAGHCSGQ